MISKKHKKISTTLNYIEYLLISTSVVTKCVSNSAFDFLVGILVGATSPAVGLKICAITAGVKKYESIIKKQEETW